MDLNAIRDAVEGAAAVVAHGAGTQWEVGGPVPDATRVRAPSGVVRYEPGDMTVTVGAGTTFAEVEALLAAEGQECPLDPRDGSATIGGILACGLSGVRRLRHGPVRDHVLEVRFVTGDARIVTGGGPTVKNVTGYDLPRLLVGSFGTLGVIGQATLRCRPRARASRWFLRVDEAHPLHRPAAILWDGRDTHVLLEGSPADVEAERGDMPECGTPHLPDGAHRGRVSVEPGRVRALGGALARVRGLRWCAEPGIGTVHVASDDAATLARARDAATDHGGWMLRETGAPALDGFGRPLPNAALARRVKEAFDPAGKLAPGRLPL